MLEILPIFDMKTRFLTIGEVLDQRQSNTYKNRLKLPTVHVKFNQRAPSLFWSDSKMMWSNATTPLVKIKTGKKIQKQCF